MAAIRCCVRQIVERFQPERVILFGSHATGKTHSESDVDLLVIMTARNEIDQSIRICSDLDDSLPLDLIVRTPEHWRRDLADGDWFLREIERSGKVLYAATHRTLGSKSRSRLGRSTSARPGHSQAP